MAEKKQIELKPCPFCGGKAEIEKSNVYCMDAVSVHCTECGATIPKATINHRFYTKGKEVQLVEEQAIQKVANEWNRRADNEQREAD